MAVRFYSQGHTYQFVLNPMAWVAASNYAANQGGHLAFVGSAIENAAIYNNSSFLTSAPSAQDGGGAAYIWLGASDISVEGVWRWTNSVSVSGYTNWGSGIYGTEPDNYNGYQDAMGMGLNSWPRPSGGIGTPGEWNDINAGNALYSIIEWDYLRGTSGADNLVGTAGIDRLMGFAGADTLTGGLGRDTLWGGVDNVRDVFDFNSIFDSRAGVAARDVINNFRSGIDDIDLRTIDAHSGTAVNDTFAFNGRIARAYSIWYSLADADSDGLVDDVIVRGDINGNTVADFEIAIIGVTSLVVGDFVL